MSINKVQGLTNDQFLNDHPCNSEIYLKLKNLDQYQSIKYFFKPESIYLYNKKKKEETPMATHDNQSSLTKQKAIFRQFEIIARKFHLWLLVPMCNKRITEGGNDAA